MANVVANKNLCVNVDTFISAPDTVDIEMEGNHFINTRKVVEIRETEQVLKNKKWWERSWFNLLGLVSNIKSMFGF